MIRPEKDLKYPPGQWVNPDVGKIWHEKTLDKAIDEYLEDLCWCDRNNLGEPGVSCGDCPTRDYPSCKNTT